MTTSSSVASSEYRSLGSTTLPQVTRATSGSGSEAQESHVSELPAVALSPQDRAKRARAINRTYNIPVPSPSKYIRSNNNRDKSSRGSSPSPVRDALSPTPGLPRLQSSSPTPSTSRRLPYVGPSPGEMVRAAQEQRAGFGQSTRRFDTGPIAGREITPGPASYFEREEPPLPTVVVVNAPSRLSPQPKRVPETKDYQLRPIFTATERECVHKTPRPSPQSYGGVSEAFASTLQDIYNMSPTFANSQRPPLLKPHDYEGTYQDPTPTTRARGGRWSQGPRSSPAEWATFSGLHGHREFHHLDVTRR